MEHGRLDSMILSERVRKIFKEQALKTQHVK